MKLALLQVVLCLISYSVFSKHFFDTILNAKSVLYTDKNLLY